MENKLQKHLEEIEFTDKEIKIFQDYGTWIEFSIGAVIYSIDLTKNNRFKKNSIRLAR